MISLTSICFSGTFESSEKTKDGNSSLLSVSGNKITILSMPMLMKVLQTAAESKTKEARFILEG